MTKPTTISKPRTVYRTYTRTQKFEKQPVSNSTTYGSTAYNWTDTRTGGNFPGWRQRIASNLDATTTLTGSKRHIKKKYGYFGISYRTNLEGDVSKTFYGDIAYCDPPSIVGIDTIAADNKAKSKFVKRCIEAQQSFNGSGFIAELAETLQMIGRPLPALKKFMTLHLDTLNVGLRRGNYFKKSLTRSQRIAAANSIVADAWLTKSFGIDPLLSDVDDAMKALAQKRYEFRKEVTPIKAKGETVLYANAGSNFHPGSPSGIKSRWSMDDSLKATVIYRGAIVRSTTSDHLPEYNEIFGLRGRDIIPGIWQGIPWSWLVDYVTNVDDILTAYSFQKTDLAWSNRTIRKEGTRYCRNTSELSESIAFVKGLAGGYWYGGEIFASTFENSASSVDRRSYTGSFVPTFEFDIMNAGTIRRLSNLSAVAWSRRSFLTTVRNVFRR